MDWNIIQQNNFSLRSIFSREKLKEARQGVRVNDFVSDFFSWYI
jgi:hypothetical protein